MTSAEALALFNEGWAKEQTGDVAGANELYERALEGADPVNAAALRSNLVSNYTKLKDVDKAWPHYWAARKMVLDLPKSTHRSNILNQLAWFLCENAMGSDLEDALVLVDASLESASREVELAVWDTKMRLLLQLGREGEARELAEVAIAVDPDHKDFQDVAKRWALGPYAALAAMRANALFREIVATGDAPPRSRNARIAAARDASVLYLFGGDRLRADVKGARGPAQRNAVFELDVATTRWRGPLGAADESPEANGERAVLPRSRHVFTATASARWLLAQGGLHEDARGVRFEEQAALADAIAFDVANAQWREVAPPEESRSPFPVAFDHAAALDRETGRVYVVLGIASDDDAETMGLDPAAGVPCLVVDTNGEPAEWKRVKRPSGVGPSLRAACSASIVGGELVVFGGTHESDAGVTHPNDVTVLHLASGEWSRPEIAGEAPLGRRDHGAIPLSDRELLVVGGRRDDTWLTDAHVLDLAARRWTRVAGDVVVPAWTIWAHTGPAPPRIFAIAASLEGAPLFELVLPGQN